jgi:hypothetical protein
MSTTQEFIAPSADALAAEFQHDAKAFVVRTETMADEVDRRRWWQAKRCFDLWNPHDEEYGGSGHATPTGGMTYGEIGDLIGKSNQTVGKWIRVWDRYRDAEYTPFSEALAILSHGGKEERQQCREETTMRKVLRERPEDAAEEIADALQDPKVAEVVLDRVRTRTGNRPEAKSVAATNPVPQRTVTTPPQTVQSPTASNAASKQRKVSVAIEIDVERASDSLARAFRRAGAGLTQEEWDRIDSRLDKVQAATNSLRYLRRSQAPPAPDKNAA